MQKRSPGYGKPIALQDGALASIIFGALTILFYFWHPLLPPGTPYGPMFPIWELSAGVSLVSEFILMGGITAVVCGFVAVWLWMAQVKLTDSSKTLIRALGAITLFSGGIILFMSFLSIFIVPAPDPSNNAFVLAVAFEIFAGAMVSLVGAIWIRSPVRGREE